MALLILCRAGHAFFVGGLNGFGGVQNHGQLALLAAGGILTLNQKIQHQPGHDGVKERKSVV